MNPEVVKDLSQILNDAAKVLPTFEGKRVLITGATGMVGSYLAMSLLTHANEVGSERAPAVIASVRNRDKANRVFSAFIDSPFLEFHYSNVEDINFREIDDVDFIIHAASSASPSFFKNDPVGIIRANVEGTWRLLEFAERSNAKFCLISTLEIYGEIASGDALVYADESAYGALDSLSLRSAYPESKRLAETSCVAYHHQYGVRSVIARLTPTYGPGIELDDGRVQAEFLRKALLNENIVLLSDGSSRRTCTHIVDATTGILTVVAFGEETAEAYNIANADSEVSIRELAEETLVAAGRSKESLTYESSNSNTLWSKSTGRIILKVDRLEALGWSAQIPLREGLARTIAFHRHNLHDQT